MAHLDRIWIDPAVRGRGLGLRLMREARHALGGTGLLVVLNPHPDGDEVPDSALKKLAASYLSDKQLVFKAVSNSKRPGWLVGSWHKPLVNEDDCTFYYLD